MEWVRSRRHSHSNLALNKIFAFEKTSESWASFIAVKSWTETGRFPALPPRKFVGLKSEMDAVIARYEKNGDWKVLRDELNLDPTVDLSKEEIYYITIKGDDVRFKFDMPNGNEAGAIPKEWVPGGATKNGIEEVALVGCETCIHSNKIENVVDFFGETNSRKIKTMSIVDSNLDNFFSKIKKDFPKLDKQLEGNEALKKMFYKDFDNASNTTLKALESEETFNIYKQYRSIAKDAVICK